MHKICAEALLKADRERGNLLHVLMLLSSSHITHLRRARRSSVLPDRLIAHSPSIEHHQHWAWHEISAHPRAGRPCNASMLECECFACRDDASSKERNRRVARIVSCDRAIRHPTIGIESYMSCIGSHIRICHAIIFIVITLYSLPAT